MELVRSFIAIELPEPVKKQLREIQSQLKLDRNPSVKKVDPAGIHLTLKFLGSVYVEKLEAITAAIQKAAEDIPPFQLQLKGLGAFPNLRRVEVIWVGLVGDLEIARRLQEEIELNLIPLNFTPEEREFTPHLTLARVRNGTPFPERQGLGERIASTIFEAGEPFRVDSINLMKSQLTRQGAIYSRLAEAPLKGSVHF